MNPRIVVGIHFVFFTDRPSEPIYKTSFRVQIAYIAYMSVARLIWVYQKTAELRQINDLNQYTGTIT